MLGDDSTARKPWPSSIDKNSGGLSSSSLHMRGGMPSGNLQQKKVDGKAQVSSHGLQRKDSLTGSDSQCYNQSGLSVVRKKRVHAQVFSRPMFYLHLFLKKRKLVTIVSNLA